jgi:hypothetical protein
MARIELKMNYPRALAVSLDHEYELSRYGKKLRVIHSMRVPKKSGLVRVHTYINGRVPAGVDPAKLGRLKEIWHRQYYDAVRDDLEHKHG